MSISRTSINNPFIVITVFLAITFLGLSAYFFMPIDLFPDTNPPQVAIITVEPGASSGNISHQITQILERELNSIDLLTNIRSTSRDEVSSIVCEFSYKKDIDVAVTDVLNVISKTKSLLPKDISEPMIFKVTDATRPVMTIALKPKKHSTKTLSDIRLIAENGLRSDFLNIPGVSDAQVFGANKKIVKVSLNKAKMRKYSIYINQVLAAIRSNNINFPEGYLYTTKGEYLFRTDLQYQTLDDLRNLIVKSSSTSFIRLKDLGTVAAKIDEERSSYFGNSEPAIAINLLRPDGGSTSQAIESIHKILPKIKAKYSDIDFSITDSQENIITVNVAGMKSSIISATIMTIFVIFLFLANMRAAGIIAISVPLSFLSTLALLKFTPYTLNMVTLSGVIIAIGMVVDASVVVLENIFRHYNLEKGKKPLKDIIISSTEEVSLAITAGMLTTVVVLVPIMFAGGYVQRVLRPLTLTMSSTLIASLLIALSVIPAMAVVLLRKDHNQGLNKIERFTAKFQAAIEWLSDIYIYILKIAMKHRKLAIILPFIFLLFSARLIIPKVGRTLMPRMDTGTIVANIDFLQGYNVDYVRKTMAKIEKIVKGLEGFKSDSVVIGSEPQAISFGNGGATLQKSNMTINFVDRMHRKANIWELEDKLRSGIKRIKGVKSFEVFEYGATPLSTIKAPVDIIITGNDLKTLSELADKVAKKIYSTKGLVDIQKSWYFDKPEFDLRIDPEKSKFYMIAESQIANQVKSYLKGTVASRFHLSDFVDIPIKLYIDDKDKNTLSMIRDLPILTPKGQIPLRMLASVSPKTGYTYITREKLYNTIDITAQLDVIRVSQAVEALNEKLADFKLPSGYTLKVSGTLDNMTEAARRILKVLIIGIALLYLLLVAMFKSFKHPLTIMVAIPLSLIGALWGMMILDKPMCMPAMMGMILLAGTIVNNSILMLDFILMARKDGKNRDEAIEQSVRLRIRPILMTTVSTVVGMIPLVFETAVGLERMSPLGTVAAFGLAFGTVFTIIVVPVFYSIMDDFFPDKFNIAKDENE